MKKSKIWIHVCVHLLLYVTLGVHSSAFNVTQVNVLRQNIPKDYKIPIDFMPKEKAGGCWVTLNVFYLESSLAKLENKFGNISSNRDNISILIYILQDLRLKMDSLETLMMEYNCHYENTMWKTEEYFNFVMDFLEAAKEKEHPNECYPPPCASPSTSTDGPTPTPSTPTCLKGCSPLPEKRLSEIVERSLLSLLLIPFIALVVLLVWRIRSRKNEEVQQSSAEDGLFTGPDGTAPPPNAEVSENTTLSVIETV